MATATTTKSTLHREPGVSEGVSVSAHVRDIYQILANTMIRDLSHSLRLVDEELEKRNIDYMIISDQRDLRLLKNFFRTRRISRNSYLFQQGEQGAFLFLSPR